MTSSFRVLRELIPVVDTKQFISRTKITSSGLTALILSSEYKKISVKYLSVWLLAVSCFNPFLYIYLIPKGWLYFSMHPSHSPMMLLLGKPFLYIIILAEIAKILMLLMHFAFPSFFLYVERINGFKIFLFWRAITSWLFFISNLIEYLHRYRAPNPNLNFLTISRIKILAAATLFCDTVLLISREWRGGSA